MWREKNGTLYSNSVGLNHIHSASGSAQGYAFLTRIPGRCGTHPFNISGWQKCLKVGEHQLTGYGTLESCVRNIPRRDTDIVRKMCKS